MELETEQERSEDYENGYRWAWCKATARQLLDLADQWQELDLSNELVDNEELVEFLRELFGCKSQAYEWIEGWFCAGDFDDSEYACIESQSLSDFIQGALDYLEELSSEMAVWRTNNVNMPRFAAIAAGRV